MKVAAPIVLELAMTMAMASQRRTNWMTPARRTPARLEVEKTKAETGNAGRCVPAVAWPQRGAARSEASSNAAPSTARRLAPKLPIQTQR